MIYTIIASNGQSYDLPAKTIAVMDSLNNILKIDQTDLGLKQKYQKILEFAVNVLGDEAVKEILGSDKVNDIDVGELELIILKIKAAYDKPIEEYRTEQLENSLEGIPTEKLVALTKAVNTINSTNVTAIKK